MKQRILIGWTFQRWLFLIFGGIMILQAVAEQQWMVLLPAGYFAAMAIFNFGCAAGGCAGGVCKTDLEPKSKTNY